MARTLRLFLRAQHGTAAAEMALVLPMLLALMFTCLEGGHYLYVQHQVVKGVRDGARFAARAPFNKFTCASVDGAWQTTVQEVTRTGAITGGTARVAGWDNAEVSVTASCPTAVVNTGIYKGMANAPRVTVQATVLYPSLFTSLSGLPTTAVISARGQAAVMGL